MADVDALLGGVILGDNVVWVLQDTDVVGPPRGACGRGAARGGHRSTSAPAPTRDGCRPASATA